ncbi:CAND7 [Scenedesmus sp. PABB004]|nr:CAND7 [Scenedesmus sp. PABB004]
MPRSAPLPGDGSGADDEDGWGAADSDDAAPSDGELELVGEPGGSEVLLVCEGVGVHPAPRAAILGRLSLVRQHAVLFLAWLPYSQQQPPPVGGGAADGDAGAADPDAARAQYAVHPVPLSDVRALVTHAPRLGGVPHLAIVLAHGLTLPPLHFHAGGLRQLLDTLQAHARLVRAAGAPHTLLVDDAPDPLARQLLDLEPADVRLGGPPPGGVSCVAAPTHGPLAGGAWSVVEAAAAAGPPGGERLPRGGGSWGSLGGALGGRLRAAGLAAVDGASSLVATVQQSLAAETLRYWEHDVTLPPAWEAEAAAEGAAVAAAARAAAAAEAAGAEAAGAAAAARAPGSSSSPGDAAGVMADPGAVESELGPFELLDAPPADLATPPGRPAAPPLGAEELAALLDARGVLRDEAAFRRRVFSGGVAPDTRREAWLWLLGVHAPGSTAAERDAARSSRSSAYAALTAQSAAIPRERRARIDKDVRRTDRMLPFFRGPLGDARLTALRDVLRCWTLPGAGGVEYVQGMSDLAATLLRVMGGDEVDTFACFATLMARLGGNFAADQAAMLAQLAALARLMQVLDPQLHAHLASCGGGGGDYLFAFRWLLVLFKRELGPDEVPRLWEACWACPLTRHLHLYVAAGVLVLHRRALLADGELCFDELLRWAVGLPGRLDLGACLATAEALATAAGRAGDDALAGLPLFASAGECRSSTATAGGSARERPAAPALTRAHRRRHALGAGMGPRRASAAAAAVSALLCCCLPAALGRVEYAHVYYDDRGLIELTQPFGFGARGHIDIVLRDISIWRRHDERDAPPQLGNFGFFLANMAADAAFASDALSAACLLDNRELQLFRFADKKARRRRARAAADAAAAAAGALAVEAVISGTAPNVTFHVEVKDGGLFSVFFANCEPRTPVSFAAAVSSYNLVGPNDRRDYLSIGEGELDVMYWVMFGLFSAITLAWAATLLRARRHGGVQKIHWLMLVLVATKSVTLLAQAIMWAVVEKYGSPHGWQWVYYVATFFRGLLFFSVIVLIGTGWSFIRPYVDDATRRVLLVVLPLQVFAEVAIIVTGEQSPSIRDWAAWVNVLHLVDILCCCAILFPIVWSIKRLREAAETDGKAARALERLTLFRSFYVAVVVFVYFTRIVVFLLRANLAGGLYAWLADAAYELAYLALYVWVGVRFAPGADNPYARLHQAELRAPLASFQPRGPPTSAAPARLTQDLSPGEVLMDIPLHCCCHVLEPPDSGASAGGAAADADDDAPGRAALRELQAAVPAASGSGRGAWQFKLALELLYHASRGGASPLAPYVATLPGVAPGTAAPQVAMLWPPDALAELQHPQLAADAGGQAHWWRAYAADVLAAAPAAGGPARDAFGGQAVGEERLGWALSVAMSRAFGFPRLGGLGGHALVPLVDQANHSGTSNAEIRADADARRVRMMANAAVRAGAPILLRYGRHGNADLLLSYGFVLPANDADAHALPHDLDLLLQAITQFVGGSAPPSGRAIDGLKTWQRTALAELGLLGGGASSSSEPAAPSPFRIGGEPPVSPELLAAVRVLLASERGAVKGQSLARLGDWHRPLSAAHEALVIKALVGLATVAYKSYPSSIQQDRAALAALGAAGPPAAGGGGADAGVAAERARVALEFRLAQKLMLERAARALLLRLKELTAG